MASARLSRSLERGEPCPRRVQRRGVGARELGCGRLDRVQKPVVPPTAPWSGDAGLPSQRSAVSHPGVIRRVGEQPQRPAHPDALADARRERDAQRRRAAPSAAARSLATRRRRWSSPTAGANQAGLTRPCGLAATALAGVVSHAKHAAGAGCARSRRLPLTPNTPKMASVSPPPEAPCRRAGSIHAAIRSARSARPRGTYRSAL